MPCGTASSYKNGCRCDACRTAMTAHRRQERRAAGAKPRTAPTHGHESMYWLGCRCGPCRGAHSTAMRPRRRRYKEAAWAPFQRAIEVAASKASTMLRLPGRPRDHRDSMLGYAAILLHRFKQGHPWDAGRFVAYAAPMIRDQLAREHGMARDRRGGNSNWRRRTISLAEARGDRRVMRW